MSSSIARKDRVKRAPREQLDDFTAGEIEVIEAARQWFPGEIAVFGSRARGNWADDSDIDLGVQGYQYTLHRDVVKRLQEVLPIKVDLFKFEHALTHRGVVTV